jgi:hypothetical protein
MRTNPSAGELDDFVLQVRRAANHRSALDDMVLQRLPGMDMRNSAGAVWRRRNGARDRRFHTDKLVRIRMVAGLIRRALPQARIPHLVRDPMDVCFSDFRVMFADAFAHICDLDCIGRALSAYRSTLARWHAAMPGQILDVQNDELVRIPKR